MLQMLQNVTKYYKIIQNITKCYQCHKMFQIYQNVTKYFFLYLLTFVGKVRLYIITLYTQNMIANFGIQMCTLYVKHFPETKQN